MCKTIASGRIIGPPVGLTHRAMHTFSAANFTDFAAAVRDFVYGCRAVIAGTSTTLPPASVTIA